MHIHDVTPLDELGIADRVPLSREQLEAFCRTHAIRELALFGSVLRDDFRPESDIDFLVRFDDSARHSLLGPRPDGAGAVAPAGPRRGAIVGMRHRLVHDYRRIRWERVWALLQDDLPELVRQLDGMIPDDADEPAT